MKILIKQARVIDPLSPSNGQTLDILIEKGKISRLGKDISSKDDIKVIQIKDLSVSPGWFDIFSNFGEPGYEFKETLESGSSAAANGGFTDVMVIPNTNPVVHNKTNVEYIVHKSAYLPANVHPIGAITRNIEGKELAEMYDMRSSGALAFSDGLSPVQSSGLLVKALQYVKAFDGIIIQVPDDKSISPQGLMNEGIISTKLGLPGKPAIGEELMISRDINLSEYAGSRIHFTGISSARSVEIIKDAKSRGIAVTCSVTPYHLFFCDEDLVHYDTNLKVNPPLRSAKDRDALRAGLLDGTIDCIATHHLPHEFDSKTVEFEYAKFGMTGLETAFAVIKTAIPQLRDEKLVQILSNNPRKIFGLVQPTIKEGENARLSLFVSNQQWTVSEDEFRSRSDNSPFTGKTLTGKVMGIINQDRLFLNL